MLLTQLGCTPKQRLDTLDPRPYTQPIESSSIVELHNQRAERLSSITARGILSLRFPDASNPNETRYEQGDLNLQLNTPDETALVLKKLGETLIWLGSNQSSYYLFDNIETEHAFVGSTEFITYRKLAQLALPLSPNSLPILLGLEQIPESAQAFTDVNSRETLIVIPAGNADVLMLFGANGYPKTIELNDHQLGPLITAVASKPIDVSEPADPFAEGPSLIRSTGQTFPSNIRIVLHESETVVTISLDNISAKRPRSAAFSFDSLVERFKPIAVIDLDAPDAESRIRQLRSPTPSSQ